MKRRLLAVHQGAELYGSDRAFLDVVAGLDRDRWSCTACLPEDGPLVGALGDLGVEVEVLPLLRLSRSRLSPSAAASLGAEAFAAMRGLDALASRGDVDLVYSSTLAVWGGALWARRRGVPHVWHVHEILARPASVAWAMRRAASLLSTRVVCNSAATRDWFEAAPPARGRDAHARESRDAVVAWRRNAVVAGRRNAVVAWNGFPDIAPPSSDEKRAARATLGIDADTPLLLMVGRVNAWKGHDLLLDAVDELCARGAAPFALAFVGGPPPGQEWRMGALRSRAARSPMSGRIRIQDFTDDVGVFYAAADIAVVPSLEPEPFGRVAVEAMGAALPVVAAAHGGLTEIVEHGQTGLHFPPGDAGSLAGALARLLDDADLRLAFGEAGAERRRLLFSLEACRAKVLEVFEEAADSAPFRRSGRSG